MAVTPRRRVELLEREAELERACARWSRRVGAPATAGSWSSRGRPGSARRSCCALSRALGEAAGLRVLRGRGAELDRPFAFGLVRQLLEREVTQSAGSPDGRSRARFRRVRHRRLASRPPRTASTARCRACSGWSPTSSRSSRCCSWPTTCTGLTPRRCAGWCSWQNASRTLPVLLVAATRPAEPGADHELLDALMTATAARVLRPAPLSEEATTTIVRGRLPEAVDELRRGVPPRDRRATRSCSAS